MCYHWKTLGKLHKSTAAWEIGTGFRAYFPFQSDNEGTSPLSCHFHWFLSCAQIHFPSVVLLNMHLQHSSYLGCRISSQQSELGNYLSQSLLQQRSLWYKLFKPHDANLAGNLSHNTDHPSYSGRRRLHWHTAALGISERSQIMK